MKVLSNVGFTMNEVINSESATMTIKDLKDSDVTINGILIGTKLDNDRETKTIGVMKTSAGVVTTISPTVLNALDTIVNAYTDNNALSEIEKGLNAHISCNKSGHNREFYTLELV